MGLSWMSCAEIVSYEPTKVQAVIDKIIEDSSSHNSDVITPIKNIRIVNHSVLFDSGGFGCYGVESETSGIILFEKIFEMYDQPLIGFEYVSPCQSQGYFFSSTWAKPEGQVDWDNSETFFRYSRLLYDEGNLSDDPDEGDFDIADIWLITPDRLTKVQQHLPHLYAAYQNALENGFNQWEMLSDVGNVISYNVACEIADNYCPDTLDDILADCNKDMLEWIKDSNDLESIEDFEMPEDFPKLQIEFLF
jgi:hypothetical protein